MIGRLLCRLDRHKPGDVRFLDVSHFEIVCARGCGEVIRKGRTAPLSRAERRRQAKAVAKEAERYMRPRQR